MADVELTVNQAAKDLGRTPRAVRQALQTGKLAGRKVRGRRGTEWRVLAESIRRQDAEGNAEGRGNGEGNQTRKDAEGAFLVAVAALGEEVRSLREENAEYRRVIELLAGRIAALEASVQKALPAPREETPRRWARFTRWFWGKPTRKDGEPIGTTRSDAVE